jgi:acetyl esterase/lipase
MRSRLLSGGRGRLKQAVFFGSFLLLLNVCATQAQQEARGRHRGQRQGGHEQRSYGDTVYATADDGTRLTWKVFPGAGPGPHPAVLVIHGGHFAATPVSPNMVRAARDAAAAGFNAFLVDYRLAGGEGLPGQKSRGQYPDQTNDLKQAVRAARAYPGGNGKVGAIGGSAGASHAVYLAATGAKGDDRVDAAVGFSGAYDLVDLLSSPRSVIRRKIENYVGSSSPEAARKASPITYVDGTVSPLFIVASDDESMPPEQLPALVRKLQAVGATNFKQVFRTNSQRHAFGNWPIVKDQVLDFLKQTLGAPSGAASSNDHAAAAGNSLPASSR